MAPFLFIHRRTLLALAIPIIVILTDRPVRGIRELAHRFFQILYQDIKHIRIGKTQLRSIPFPVNQCVIFRMSFKIQRRRHQQFKRMDHISPFAICHPVQRTVIYFMPIRIEWIKRITVMRIPKLINRHLRIIYFSDLHLFQFRIIQHLRRQATIAEILIEKRINPIKCTFVLATDNRQSRSLRPNRKTVLSKRHRIYVRTLRSTNKDFMSSSGFRIQNHREDNTAAQCQQPAKLMGGMLLTLGCLWRNNNHILTLSLIGQYQRPLLTRKE